MKYFLKLFFISVTYFAISFVGVNILRYLIIKPFYKYTVFTYSGVGHPCYGTHPSLPHASKQWNFAADYSGYAVEAIFLAIGYLLLTRMAGKSIFQYLGMILINTLLFEAISYPVFWVGWYLRKPSSFLGFILTRPIPVYIILAFVFIVPVFTLRWTIKRFLTKKETLSFLYITPLAFCFCYIFWFYFLPAFIYKLQN